MVVIILIYDLMQNIFPMRNVRGGGGKIRMDLT